MKLLEMIRKLSGLKEIPRVGWSLAGICKDEVEDVAQHSFDVASVSLILAEDMRKKGISLNLEKLLVMAVVHDWLETIVGDFPYPAIEYLRDKKSKEEMEFKAAQELFRDSPDLMEAWKEFTKGEILEAKIVRAADYLSILVQALRFMERGYCSEDLQKLWKNVVRDLLPLFDQLPQIKELVEQLESEKSRFK